MRKTLVLADETLVSRGSCWVGRADGEGVPWNGHVYCAGRSKEETVRK